jgi:SNF2 family DNA or RNA helicase
MEPIVRNYIQFCKKKQIKVQPYQVYGILWALKREKGDSSNLLKRGGIIADEMGMGKTIQMIGIMLLNIQYKILIILPPILIKQWFTEIKKFTGHCSTVYYGNKRNLLSLENSIVVITSYETLLRDKKIDQITWNRVICDEAHHLRNPKTKAYQKIKKIKTNILWLMTGTPIQNSSKDIISLFSLLNISSSDTILMKSHFLSRTKKSVGIQIPDKKEESIFVEWKNDDERELATDIHCSIPLLHFESNESFWCKRDYPILVSMIRAKQTCILHKLVQPSVSTKKNEWEDETTMPDKYLNLFHQNSSSKLIKLISFILTRISNGNGKIIFCHFRQEMIQIIEALTYANTRLVQKIWIGTWKDYRKINKLTGLSPILILQIQSGSEGLNLQEYFSEVYFVSPHWNPTIEDQAIARCHRIGQRKEVQVFRYYMNFIEDPIQYTKRVFETQIYKWFLKRIPADISHHIYSYISTNEKTLHQNYSLDQYTLQKQNIKTQNSRIFLHKFK